MMTNVSMMTRSVVVLLAQLGPLERLDDNERLDEHKHKLLDDDERLDDDEERGSTFSTARSSRTSR